MFVNSSNKIIGNTYVQCCIIFIRNNVDIVFVHVYNYNTINMGLLRRFAPRNDSFFMSLRGVGVVNDVAISWLKGDYYVASLLVMTWVDEITTTLRNSG